MEEQKGFFGILERYLMGPMGKIASYKVVRAITAAGMAAVPFTIVGSMFLVFSILPLSFSFWPVVADIFAASFDKFTALYMVANYATMGSLSLYFVLTIGYELTKIYAEEEELDLTPLNGALLSLFAFIMTVPQIVFEKGMMSSVISLKEGGVVAFFVIILNGILVVLGTDIFQVIAIPFGFVANLTSTWIGLVIIYLLTQALWIVGIHGANIIFAFVTPIALANMTLNAGGERLVVAGEFSNMFVIAGGSGATLGLCIWLATRAKSEQLSAIGKASIVPGFFNINEPLIFGLPIIYNPSLAIPFMLAPVASMTVYYFSMKLELIKPVIAQVPWPTPVGIGAFLGTTDWKAIIVALLCALVAFLIYYPFIKIYDKQLLKEEAENAAELG
ncbi:PTS transporter subunit EIIC [Streptococcus pluranimalium]